jgi:hypothetical protein
MTRGTQPSWAPGYGQESKARRRIEVQALTAMRDLLELSEHLDFTVEAGRVTVLDDLQRRLSYATNGKRETHQLGTTEFTSRTRWSETALMQTFEVGPHFQMTEALVPSEDRSRLFVVLKVTRPTLSPPVKNIERVYTRAPKS